MGSTSALEALESRRLLSSATGSISGLVFDDVNHDGVRDRKERALPGVRVFLDANNDGTFQKKTERSLLTDADGRYRFEDLAPGKYTVRQVVASDKTIAKPTSGVYRVSIGAAGRAVAKRDFANVEKSKPTTTTTPGGANSGFEYIGGSEYNSVGGLGSFSGTSYGAGDTLVKYTWNGDANFDGHVTFDDYVKIDTGFNSNITGWFNGDFNYSGSVNFDDYALIDIAFNQQNGTLGRAISYISGEDRSSSGTSSAGLQSVIQHLDQFGSAYGAAFLSGSNPGDRPAVTSGSVAGLVFKDFDGDGSRDANELAMSGQRVFLERKVNGSWKRVAYERTDANGRYTFTNVTPGKYRVREAAARGTTTSKPTSGLYLITVKAGKLVSSRNFANEPV